MTPIKRLWNDGKVYLVVTLALVVYNLVLAVIYHDLNYLVIALWIMLVLWAQSCVLYWQERADYWRNAYFEISVGRVSALRDEVETLNASIRSQAADLYALRRTQAGEE